MGIFRTDTAHRYNQTSELPKNAAWLERQRTEQEHQRADRLAEYLHIQGINPDKIL